MISVRDFWFFGWYGHYEYSRGCVSAIISHYSNGTLAANETRRSYSERGSGQTQGTFIKDLAVVSSDSGANVRLYALEEFINPEVPTDQTSTKRADGSYSQDVVI